MKLAFFLRKGTSKMLKVSGKKMTIIFSTFPFFKKVLTPWPKKTILN